MAEDPAAKLERELRTLLPVALALAHRDGKDRAATAEHLVRVVMTCARPLMEADDTHHPRPSNFDRLQGKE